MAAVTIDQALSRIGTGPFHYRLLGIFGLVWAADAMQVLAIGFAAPSLATDFRLSIPEAVQAGTALFLGMLVGAWGFGRLADRIGRRRVLVVTVMIDAVFSGSLRLFHQLRDAARPAVAGRDRSRRYAAGRLRHDG